MTNTLAEYEIAQIADRRAQDFEATFGVTAEIAEEQRLEAGYADETDATVRAMWADR